MSAIADNWRRARAAVDAAARRAGRDPGTVRIVVAAKTKSAALVDEAIAAGATEFGENYVQEAIAKIPLVQGRARWHLIGHLQRNKAARAVELFDVVQTVDRLELASALARRAEALGTQLAVLIEVNLGGEEAKSGVSPAAVPALVERLGGLPQLRVDGLMAIPPAADDPADARRHFRALRELSERLRAAAPPNVPLGELSMGMSGDYEVAVEEGATIVRIGRAILGERSSAAGGKQQ